MNSANEALVSIRGAVYDIQLLRTAPRDLHLALLVIGRGGRRSVLALRALDDGGHQGVSRLELRIRRHARPVTVHQQLRAVHAEGKGRRSVAEGRVQGSRSKRCGGRRSLASMFERPTPPLAAPLPRRRHNTAQTHHRSCQHDRSGHDAIHLSPLPPVGRVSPLTTDCRSYQRTYRLAGNGLCSLAEIENFIMSTLISATDADQGRALFDGQ